MIEIELILLRAFLIATYICYVLLACRWCILSLPVLRAASNDGSEDSTSSGSTAFTVESVLNFAWRFVLTFTGPQHGIEEQVRRLIEAKKVAYFKRVMTLGSYFMSVALINHVASSFSALGGEMDADDARHRLNEKTFLWGAMCFILCTICTTFPKIVTVRTLDFCSVMTSFRIVGSMLLCQDLAELNFILPELVFTRLAISVIVCNARLTSVMNIAVAGFHTYVYLTLSSQSSAVSGVCDKYCIQFDRCRTAVLREFGFVMGTGLMAGLAEHWLASEALSFLQTKKLELDVATVDGLLSGMCDATVVLQSDLRISGSAPKLANLLLRGNAGKDLDGKRFTSLVNHSDHDRLHHFFENLSTSMPRQTGIDPHECVMSLNVHMKGANGMLVGCQIFASCFLNLEGVVTYRVGICEQCEDSRALERAVEPSPAVDTSEITSSQKSQRKCQNSPETSIGSDSSFSQSNLREATAWAHFPSLAKKFKKTTCVCFDSWRAEWPIMAYTEGFNVLKGQQEVLGTSLMEWIPDVCCRSRLQQFLESALNHCMNLPLESAPRNMIIDLEGRMTLQPPGLMSELIQLRATCTITLCNPLSDQDWHFLPAVLQLSDIELRNAHSNVPHQHPQISVNAEPNVTGKVAL